MTTMRSVWVSMISSPFSFSTRFPRPSRRPTSCYLNRRIGLGDTLGNYSKTNGEGDAIRRASRPTARDRDFRTGSFTGKDRQKSMPPASLAIHH